MKNWIVAALAAWTMTGALFAAEATPAEAPAAPAAAAGALWHFEPPVGTRTDQVVHWLRAEIQEAGRDLRRHRYVRARMRLANARDEIWHYPNLRWTIAPLDDAIGDIRRGSYNSADHTMRRLYQRLGQHGGGGGGNLAEIIDDLQDALRDFRRNDISGARMNLQAAYREAVRSQWPRVRQEAEAIRQADQAAAYGQIHNATRITSGVLRRLQSGGGGGNPGDPDYGNRQEWRRDIRDLIDTIMDHNLRMARRDLQTLQRDIRQDGHDWNTNRRWVQRLSYIGQNLYAGNETWCIQQLRQLSQQLNY